MKVFSNIPRRDLIKALSHVHLLAPVVMAERDGDELGDDFHDPAHPAVNRFIVFLQDGSPEEPCWIDGPAGAQPVTAVHVHPGGVRILLDRSQARPPAGPTSSAPE